MKSLKKVVFLIGFLFAATVGGQGVFAQPEISVMDAWVRFAPPTVKAHAGYMILHNKSGEDQVLVGASSDKYGRVELHRSLEKDGVMIMEEAGELTIKAGEKLEFAPGGLHLMLMMPKYEQVLGEKVQLELTFKGGASLALESVIAKGGKADHSGMKHHHH